MSRLPSMGRIWLLPVAAALTAMLIGLAWLRQTPPLYTASMTVAPLAERGVAGMGIRLPATHTEPDARITLPGQEENLTDFRRFLALLTTRPVAAELAQDPRILTGAFAEMWDDRGSRWMPPDGFGPRLRRWLASAAGRPAWTPPDEERMSRHLRERLIIEPVGTTPLRRIVYRHRDRAFALHVLDRLYHSTDARLRAEAARRSGAQIAHMRARLAEITESEHRAALADMLAGYERILLLLEVDLPFAADLIEPPHAATVPDTPDPVLWLAVTGFAGFAAGCLALRVPWTAVRSRRRGREVG